MLSRVGKLVFPSYPSSPPQHWHRRATTETIEKLEGCLCIRFKKVFRRCPGSSVLTSFEANMFRKLNIFDRVDQISPMFLRTTTKPMPFLRHFGMVNMNRSETMELLWKRPSHVYGKG